VFCNKWPVYDLNAEALLVLSVWKKKVKGI
jgi:hypothetical protein